MKVVLVYLMVLFTTWLYEPSWIPYLVYSTVGIHILITLFSYRKDAKEVDQE